MLNAEVTRMNHKQTEFRAQSKLDHFKGPVKILVVFKGEGMGTRRAIMREKVKISPES